MKFKLICLSYDPFQRLAFMAPIEGSHLRMNKHSDRANQPMVPLVPDNDGDTLYLLLVVSDEPCVIFKSLNVLPAVESGSINQQSDFPVLTDERIYVRRNIVKVVGFQFLRRRDPQRIGGNHFCLDQADTPSRSPIAIC